jgi:hypothetical protein
MPSAAETALIAVVTFCCTPAAGFASVAWTAHDHESDEAPIPHGDLVTASSARRHVDPLPYHRPACSRRGSRLQRSSPDACGLIAQGSDDLLATAVQLGGPLARTWQAAGLETQPSSTNLRCHAASSPLCSHEPLVQTLRKCFDLGANVVAESTDLIERRMRLVSGHAK